MTGTPLVRISGLTRVFDVSKPWLNRVIERLPRALLTAVSDVSFDIPERGVYALVGESGSGKSTIGKMVVGLLRPSEGSVLIRDIDLAQERDPARIAAARSEIQMIFQDPFASLNPRWRVRDIITEPVTARGGDAAGLAERLLDQVGLSARDAGKYPHEFSGGQRQRICIARALASNPKLIVCDEPTSALDVSVQAAVLNLMRRLQDEYGLTYLFISHNLTVVDHMSDDVGVMYLGRLVELQPTENLFDAPRHPYTQLLIQTVPSLDTIGRASAPLKGEVPSPLNPPPGCAFNPRCPFANERCRVERPEATALPGGGMVACHAVEEGRI